NVGACRSPKLTDLSYLGATRVWFLLQRGQFHVRRQTHECAGLSTGVWGCPRNFRPTAPIGPTGPIGPIGPTGPNCAPRARSRSSTSPHSARSGVRQQKVRSDRRSSASTQPHPEQVLLEGEERSESTTRAPYHATL